MHNKEKKELKNFPDNLYKAIRQRIPNKKCINFARISTLPGFLNVSRLLLYTAFLQVLAYQNNKKVHWGCGKFYDK